MRCTIKEREIGMAVKLYIVSHEAPQFGCWVCVSYLKVDQLLTLSYPFANSVINALEVPSSGKRISIELADDAGLSFDLKILSFDSSLPPSLGYSPSFERLSYPLCPPFVEEGDWLMLIAFLNFKLYRSLK